MTINCSPQPLSINKNENKHSQIIWLSLSVIISVMSILHICNILWMDLTEWPHYRTWQGRIKIIVPFSPLLLVIITVSVSVQLVDKWSNCKMSKKCNSRQVDALKGCLRYKKQHLLITNLNFHKQIWEFFCEITPFTSHWFCILHLACHVFLSA